ncbi:hypothetical protein [Microbacterium sp.]|uniref:hypothetical protein n=1 Tax=Microbacterium sp. TaxID=51671 RepID=UPI003221D9D0
MSNEHTNAEDGSTDDGVQDVATGTGPLDAGEEAGAVVAGDEAIGGADAADDAVADAGDSGAPVEDAGIERAADADAVADTPAGDSDASGHDGRPDALVPAGSTPSDDGIPPQYGVGPFSIREVSLAGVWLLAFVVSFFPIYGAIGAAPPVWGSGIDWVLTIGAPTAAVFLLVLRRLSPQGIRRVGSLGVDQFASVAFSVAAIVWLGILWSAFVTLAKSGVFFVTWVVWVELVLMLAGVVLTVVAPVLPVLGEDFRHRPESVAHRNARRVRPVAARPVVVREPRTDAVPAVAVDTPVATPTADGDVRADTAATVAQAPVSQAFWALVPVERDVVDEHGAPLFRIGPTAWALVIEDRGTSFVVRHEDGRVGHLHDVSGVTRG